MVKRFNDENFLKTYVKSAEALMDGLEVKSSDDLKFRDNVHTVVKLYPSMVNAALELNKIYGYDIELPKTTPEEDFDKVDEFYSLFVKVSDAANQDERLKNTKTLYDVSAKTLNDDLAEIGSYLAEEEDASKKYWLKHSLMLSQVLTSELQKNESWKIRIRVEEDEIAEQLLSSMVKKGVKVNTGLIEDFRGALGDAGERLSVMKTKPSNEVVLRELLKRFKYTCKLDNKDEKVASSIGEVMEQYTKIVKKSRPTILKSKQNFIEVSMAMKSIPDVVSHEDMNKIISRRKLNQELEIKNSRFRIPSSFDMNKIFVNVISEEDINQARLPQNEIEKKWYDYKNAKIENPKIKAGMKILVSNWADEALTDMYSVQDTLSDMDTKYEDSDDDDDDDLGLNHSEYSGYQHESEEAKEDRLMVAKYAEELVNLGSASKKYLSLIINDSPVSHKIVERIENSAKWGEFELNALNMLFNNVDNNALDKQDIIQADKGKVSEDFIDAALELPSSLEKRALLIAMKGGLARMESHRMIYKTDCEDELVDFISEEHRSEYKKLEDYLKLGADVYEDIDEDTASSLAQDINIGACLQYVVPIYADKEVDENALSMVLDNVMDYEDLGAPSQKFVRGLSKKYVQALSDLHNKKLDDGDFSREIFAKIEEYDEKREDIDNVSAYLAQTVDVLSAENHIYEQFIAYENGQGKNKENHILMLKSLQNHKFCNN